MLLEEPSANALVDGVGEEADQVWASRSLNKLPQNDKLTRCISHVFSVLGLSLASRCVLRLNETTASGSVWKLPEFSSLPWYNGLLTKCGVSPAGALSIPRPASC